MDPLSVATSVITLADAATKLYKFLRSVKGADSGYAALCTELSSISSYVQSISEALKDCERNPLALAPIDEDVWRQSRVAIADCQQTINDLSILVKRVGGLDRPRKLFRRARLTAEMHIHARDVVAFRDKMHMSNLSLQTLLQVINTSLSLRSNASQEETLRELKQLNQFLEKSSHVASDPNSLFAMGGSDAYILKNLKGLVRAARGFHAAASIAASTVHSDGSNASAHQDVQQNYEESTAMPIATPMMRRYIDTFLRRPHLPMMSQSLAQNYDTVEEPLHVPYTDDPEVFAPPSETELADQRHHDHGLNYDFDFNSLFSSGLIKMAHKAVESLDFAKAEIILQQAIDRHRISGPDDSSHSQLRIQLVLCGFLQGKSRQLAETVEDIAEFRGTKRTIANQLLYILALSRIHDLEHDAAQRVCERLLSGIGHENFSGSPLKSDILKLLVVSYQLSGQALLADAIQEGHPETLFQSKIEVPTAIDFILKSHDLFAALFRTDTLTTTHQNVARLLQHREKSATRTLLQLSQVGELSNFDSTSYDGDEETGASPLEIPTGSRRLLWHNRHSRRLTMKASIHQEDNKSSRGSVADSILVKTRSTTSHSTTPNVAAEFAASKRSSRKLRKRSIQGIDRTESETVPPRRFQTSSFFDLIGFSKKAKETNREVDGEQVLTRILDRMRAKENYCKSTTVTTSVSSELDVGGLLEIRSTHPAELVDNCVFELDDTSSPYELHDTSFASPPVELHGGFTPARIIKKHPVVRSSLHYSIMTQCSKDTRLSNLGKPDQEHMLHKKQVSGQLPPSTLTLEQNVVTQVSNSLYTAADGYLPPKGEKLCQDLESVSALGPVPASDQGFEPVSSLDPVSADSQDAFPCMYFSHRISPLAQACSKLETSPLVRDPSCTSRCTLEDPTGIVGSFSAAGGIVVSGDLSESKSSQVSQWLPASSKQTSAIEVHPRRRIPFQLSRRRVIIQGQEAKNDQSDKEVTTDDSGYESAQGYRRKTWQLHDPPAPFD